MRYTLAIGVFLLSLGVILSLTMRNEPRDPFAFNPEEISVSSNLINSHGNVLWISVEGLRPDHMSTMGYPNVTTPRIDSFASESMVFERCYSQSTESYRSIATMLTSQYPSAYPSSPGNVGKGFRDLLSQTETSLVGIIRDGGHTTAAIVGNPILKAEFGFNSGFDYYNDEPVIESNNSIRDRTSEEIYAAAESWLSRNFRRPFFFFVHFSEPRGPFNPDSGYLKQLRELPSYTNQKTLEVVEKDVRPQNALPSFFGKQGDSFTIGELKRMYDGEIAEVDFYIGELLDAISRLGISDETMIIISGSHGEILGEHGYYFSDGGAPYRCLSQVPLIIHNPNGIGGRVKDSVEGIDIMPTILSYLDIKNAPSFAGMNLLRFYEKRSLKFEYPAFCCWDDPKVISIIKGDYELISFDDREFKLYQIINDPDEMYDLYSDDDSTAQDLKMLLETWNRLNHEKALEKEIKDEYGPPSHKAPMIIPQEHLTHKPK